jgi:hypothetical protein
MHEHLTQFGAGNPFLAMGIDGWRDGWAKEAFILRESRVKTMEPESDLFAGIA